MHQMELEPEMAPSIPSAGLQGSYVFKHLCLMAWELSLVARTKSCRPLILPPRGLPCRLIARLARGRPTG